MPHALRTERSEDFYFRQLFEGLEFTEPARNIYIYSMERGFICKDESCRTSTHRKANQMYETIKKVYEFFAERFSLYGIDGTGRLAPIRLDWSEDNAAWICSSYIDGHACSLTFNNKYVRPEVVAHEYTHAIISSLNPLNYVGQSGALNESLADVFGIAFKHWLTGDTEEWTVANRDLSAHPGPFISTNRPTDQNDYGYVHQNSTIPSHAFYMTIQNSGKTEKLISQIWFDAMKEVSPNETFHGFAEKTIAKALKISKNLARAVAKSWHHVGVQWSVA